ncbi:MAG: hypothetical protein AAFN12_16510, partial [Cyanobacteria bacterium J06560_2]
PLSADNNNVSQGNTLLEFNSSNNYHQAVSEVSTSNSRPLTIIYSECQAPYSKLLSYDVNNKNVNVRTFIQP